MFFGDFERNLLVNKSTALMTDTQKAVQKPVKVITSFSMTAKCIVNWDSQYCMVKFSFLLPGGFQKRFRTILNLSFFAAPNVHELSLLIETVCLVI